MGLDYAGIKFVSTKDGCAMRYVVCKDAQKGAAEQTVAEQAVKLTAMPKPYTQKYAVDDIPQPRSATPWMYVRAKRPQRGHGQRHQGFRPVCLQ